MKLVMVILIIECMPN